MSWAFGYPAVPKAPLRRPEDELLIPIDKRMPGRPFECAKGDAESAGDLRYMVEKVS